MFRVVRVVSRPFGVPMDESQANCSLYDSYLCIMVTPQFCITQCLECFSLQGMHSLTLTRNSASVLFRQQEFLWNSNQGALAQDWVVRIVGYAVAHDQDSDIDTHH